jgi:hypothetical protein
VYLEVSSSVEVVGGCVGFENIVDGGRVPVGDGCDGGAKMLDVVGLDVGRMSSENAKDSTSYGAC